MGFKKKTIIENVERSKIYIVIHEDLTPGKHFELEFVRAFSTEDKAKDYCKYLRNKYSRYLCGNGMIFKRGAFEWRYHIKRYEIDLDLDEVGWVGTIPIPKNDEETITIKD